jgi:hypothetical protein
VKEILFSSVVKAARAYDAEARRKFGKFACVNFPVTENITNKKG